MSSRKQRKDDRKRRHQRTAGKLKQQARAAKAASQLGYTSPSFRMEDAVKEPHYASLIDWLEAAEYPALAFDIWARGNFTRRLLYQRQHDVTPAVVAVESVAQMRWAYRRLALLGCPVDYIYNGHLSAPKRVLTLYPYDRVHDCGWGYIAALGSTCDISGNKWFPIMGTSRLIANEVVLWLLDEARHHLQRGTVFVAPRELIGVGQAEEGSRVMADVTGGIPVQHLDTLGRVEPMLNIELPYLDGLTAADFTKFLGDYDGEIADFQRAFNRLMRSELDTPNIDALKTLQDEVSALASSARYQRMRSVLQKCKGVWKTWSFAIGAAGLADAIQFGSPIGGPLAAGAAGLVLRDLWRSTRENVLNRPRNLFFLLWRLGATKNMGSGHRRWQIAETKQLDGDLGPCHWLCPPTNGLQYLLVQK